MSLLANEIYEYLSKTGGKRDKYSLQTKYNVNNAEITRALESLVESEKVVTESSIGKKLYLVPREKSAPAPTVFVMKPYRQPNSMTERYREIVEQKAAFPSRFN